MTNYEAPSLWPETDDDYVDFSYWQYEVANGDTVLGFRDWLSHKEEADA